MRSPNCLFPLTTLPGLLLLPGLCGMRAAALPEPATSAPFKNRAESPAPNPSASVAQFLKEASALLEAGKQAEALARVEQALAAANSAGDLPGVVSAERERALRLEALGRKEEARSAWQAAALTWERVGDGTGLVEAPGADAKTVVSARRILRP